MPQFRAAFLLILIIQNVLWVGTAFSETCDPSPFYMEEGQTRGTGETDSLHRDVRSEGRPSRTEIVGPKKTPKTYGCKRAYLYKGKLRPVDSFNRQDGEKLRPLLASIPDSVENLNTYQHNRRKVQTGAYLGTAGLIIALGSFIMSHQYGGDTRNQIRAIGVLSGLSIAIGSTVYSLAILRTNESYLQRSVDHYNRAKPDDPIVLQFSTGILF